MIGLRFGWKFVGINLLILVVLLVTQLLTNFYVKKLKAEEAAMNQTRVTMIDLIIKRMRDIKVGCYEELYLRNLEKVRDRQAGKIRNIILIQSAVNLFFTYFGYLVGGTVWFV